MNQFDKNVVVDVPLIPPNCLASISPSIVSSTRFIIIDSNTLAAIGISEIGINVFFNRHRWDCFGNGITLAIFHFIGSTPSLSELLKIAVNGSRGENICMVS